jgi:hypothetical protein
VPKKKRGSRKRGGFKPVSAKTRAADDKLREALRNADLKKFERLLAKAVSTD